MSSQFQWNARAESLADRFQNWLIELGHFGEVFVKDRPMMGGSQRSYEVTVHEETGGLVTEFRFEAGPGGRMEIVAWDGNEVAWAIPCPVRRMNRLRKRLHQIPAEFEILREIVVALETSDPLA